MRRNLAFVWRNLGSAAAWLGGLGVLSVLCFRYPEWLTTPQVRASLDIELLRVVLLAGLLAGLALGVVAWACGPRRRAGLVGIVLVLAAFALGGHDVPAPSAVPPRAFYVGLDYFVLSLFFTAIPFLLLERLWPRDRGQQVNRREVWLDLRHFALNHLGISIVLLTVSGATAAATTVGASAGLQGWVRDLPLPVAFVLIVLIADVTQYWQHRLFHRVPFLWRFHAVHHSIEAMDWIAGSRLHFLEILFQRALVIAPAFLLGFERQAIDLYIVFAGTITVFIHANLGIDFGWLRYVVATPAFHHWHHALTPRDKNFAVHLPVLDLLFGTFHAPAGQWPARYGIDGERLPFGLIRQHLYPFGLSSSS